jgi:hypothetical protein
MTANVACAFSIADFSLRNGIGQTTAYKEIKAGRLIARKIGRRTIITADDEQKWRVSLPQLQGVTEA